MTGRTRLALIRTDGSQHIGAGHLARCVALGRGLERRGWTVRLAGIASGFNLIPLPPWPRFVVEEGPGAEPGRLAKWLGREADLLIVDHYGRDAAFERACRSWAREIMVLDDLADRPHDCDWLVDSTPFAVPSAYRRLVPDNCRILAGADFALLRSGFAHHRWRRAAAHRVVETIFVALGATDPGRHLPGVLEALTRAGFKGRLLVSLSSTAAHFDEVRRRTMQAGGEILPADADMAAALATADLAIGAGGVGLLERACLGLPMVLLPVAANQRGNIEAVGRVQAAAICPDPSDIPAITGTIKDLLVDAGARAALGREAAKLCDGLGVNRCLTELEGPHRDPAGRVVALRRAAFSDGQVMLDWQSHPDTRRHARNPNVPTPSEHESWLRVKIDDPACLFNILCADQEPVGLIRLDWVPAREGFEVSIVIDPARRGQGYGRLALDLARRLVAEETLWAHVLEANDASRRLFLAAGYRPAADADWYFNPGSPTG